MLFIHETFLVNKLETFKNFKEVKHIMIMIIAIVYIFVSYVIFDQQLKITFRKFSPALKKSTPHPYSLSPKNLKSASPPFLPIFQPLPPPTPAERRGHYVTHIIQPLFNNLPSCIKDTKTFPQPHWKTSTTPTQCTLSHSWCHVLIHKHSTWWWYITHHSFHGEIQASLTHKLPSSPYSSRKPRFHSET